MNDETKKNPDFEQDDVTPTDEEGNPLPDKKRRKAELVGDEDIVTEEAGEDEVQKIREKLKKCVEEKQEYLNGWQRTKADYVNMQRSNEAAKKDYIKFANANLIEDIFPVLESFQMAFGNKEAWEKVSKEWRVGVEYIHSQLLNTLASHGLKEVDPNGETFDPTKHEAIEFVPVEDSIKNNVIISVIQKGYELNGKLVRAPKVRVGEHPDKS